VLVSEFMLQQTQVERVVPIFETFVARFSDFGALAAATQADTVRAWRGLGYNSRAVRLHKLARTVVERYRGKLPEDLEQLRALPGIGPYTARAVAAFAFDADLAAVDTNVRRIVHRTQWGIEFPPRASARALEDRAAELVPPGRAFAFNSAMMDLGAGVCTARTPNCSACPVASHCAAAPIDPGLLARRRERHAVPRSPAQRVAFERSTRYVRGRVVDRLRELGPREAVSLLDLHSELAGPPARCDRETFALVVAGLVSDGIVETVEGHMRLAH
jgi:A/G-specific adenine glycosylase